MPTALKYPEYTVPIDKKKCTLERKNPVADFHHTIHTFSDRSYCDLTF